MRVLVCTRVIRKVSCPGEDGRGCVAGRGLFVTFVIETSKTREMISRCLLINWPGMLVHRMQCGHGYSALRNSAIAMPSIPRPMAATMASDSPSGTCQPNQVMPGLSLFSTWPKARWANTACRIGSTT